MTTKKKADFIAKSECSALAEVMNRKYGAFLRDGYSFSLSTRLEDNIVHVKVLLVNGDCSFYYPVEARIDCVENELESRKAALFLMDYIDVYFEEYLTESDNILLPIDWTDHEYEANYFQIKGQIFNKKVDQMADELLANGKPYKGPQIIF